MSDAFHLAEAASKLLKLNPDNFHGEFTFELHSNLFLIPIPHQFFSFPVIIINI